MKEQFFAKLEGVVGEAKRLRISGFGDQEPEEATKQLLLEPLLQALGFSAESNYVREFKILGDSVDYLLKAERPLIFVEAKSLHDCPNRRLFEKHREQVLGYIQNYRLSPEITKMEQPVKWILLTNVAQFHFIRVNEVAPTFSFSLEDLWERRELLWELLGRENLEADRIDELYDQQLKAELDQQFLVDLKRWRLLLANGFAFRNQSRPVGELTLASQELLDRFIFCRMLETHRLVEYNKLARTFSQYEELYGRADKTFAEVLRETLFREIKNDFNTELFTQPLLCDALAIDNVVLAAVVGHEPLAPELAEQCGFESGHAELLAFRHLYSYDFSRMSQDVMGAVYERFLAHRLLAAGGRIVIEDTDELRKKEGIYYTPRYIVDYIVQHTLGEKIKPVVTEAKSLLGYGNYPAAFAKVRELGRVKVLDPAMGSGSFLLRAFDLLMGAYEEYNQECRRHKRAKNGAGTLFDADLVVPEEVLDAPLRVLTENIFGVDLDEKAVEVAKLNLWLRYMAVNRAQFIDQLRRRRRGGQPLNLLPNLTENLKHGNSLIEDPAVAGEAAFDWRKEFPETVGGGGFDVVIGNPPYERIQTMQAQAPEAVEFLKANYRSAASGNFDIYVCFIERGLQLLRKDGQFGYICPHKFFQAEYGEPLRKFLSEGQHVRHVVSFGDQQVFPSASTYTCLLFLDNLPQAGCRFVKVDDLETWRSKGEATEARFPSEHFTRGEWHFTVGASAPVFQKLSEMPNRLADVATRMYQGPITSADGVFLFEEFRTTARRSVTEVLSVESSAWVPLETGLLKRVVRSGSIGRYWANGTAVVLFPYEVKHNEAKLLSAVKLQKSFPLGWDYLQRHRKLLEEREGGSFGDEAWYRFGRTQNLGMWEQPKLMVPYMITELGAYLDRDESLYFINVTTGGYGVTVEEEKIRLPYLCALLNSRLLDFYLKQVSTNFRGGYFAANKQFLDKLPIKLIDPKNKREANLEKEIVQRVDTIQALHRQRIKLPKVLRRLIAHDAERVACPLAHYLQKDYGAWVKGEILLADVKREGFVHEIRVEPEGKGIAVIATVAEAGKGKPMSVPVVRLAFKDEALRQFVYGCWRHFLAEHARQKKWTKGKKAEPVYALVVNTLEPLVYFSASAAENLRRIQEIMRAVAKEAGTGDLAALEAEIARLDGEIDASVYELYGLTAEEQAIVEGKSS